MSPTKQLKPPKSVTIGGWCAVPPIICMPQPGETDSEPTPDSILDAMRIIIHKCASLKDQEKHEKILEYIAALNRDNRMGKVMMVTWNLCQDLAFTYGNAMSANGEVIKVEKDKKQSAKYASMANMHAKNRQKVASDLRVEMRDYAAEELKKRGKNAWDAIVGEVAKKGDVSTEHVLKRWLNGMNPNRRGRRTRG